LTEPNPGLIGAYRPLRLLSDGPHVRVLEASRGDEPPVIVKICVTVTPFDDRRSAFYQSAPDFHGPGSPNNLVEQEGRALARLFHSSVPRLIDTGVHAGLPFAVIERVPGSSVEALELDRLDWAALDAIARGLLAALAHAHAHGVVHRDVSCANVIVDLDATPARVALIDFELAAVDGRGIAGTVGSAAYRAPEVTWDGAASLDPRADLYSAGVVLYRLLTARFPFPERATMALDHVATPPPWPPALSAPPVLRRLAERLLAKDPDERIASAQDALRLLTDEGGPEPLAAVAAPLTAALPELGRALRTRRTAELARALRQLSAPRRVAPQQANTGRDLLLGTLAQDARLAARVELWDHAIQCCSDYALARGREPAVLAVRALAELRQGHVNRAVADLSELIDAAGPDDGPALALAAPVALEAGAADLAVALALAASDAVEPSGSPNASHDAAVLRTIAGELVLLMASTPSLDVVPLTVACAHLGIRERLFEPSSAARAARWFRRAVEVAGAIPTRRMGPVDLLHLGVAAWALGHAEAVDLLQVPAALSPEAQLALFGYQLTDDEEVGGPAAVLFALRATRQHRLVTLLSSYPERAALGIAMPRDPDQLAGILRARARFG
jgi:tetratricopeptide (TPR) repeat protein